MLIALISAAFLYLNYTSIMSSDNDTRNRFSVVSNDGEEGMPAQGDVTEPEKKEPGENAPEKPKGDADNDKNENYGALYEFEIEDGAIGYQTSDDSLYQSSVLTNVVTLVIFVVGIITVILISLFVSKIVIEPVAKNEEKQKAFISDTSHEMKTPLAVIAANAEVLESEVGQNKWLGLSNVETTLIYAYADTEMKRRAIESATPPQSPLKKFLNSKRYTISDEELIKQLYGLR